MFRDIYVDRTVVLFCAAFAVIIAAMVVGSVPYSTLDHHLLAYVGAGLLLGIASAIGFLVFCDRVLFPFLDGIFQGIQDALDERALREHEERMTVRAAKPFRPKRAGLPRR